MPIPYRLFDPSTVPGPGDVQKLQWEGEDRAHKLMVRKLQDELQQRALDKQKRVEQMKQEFLRNFQTGGPINEEQLYQQTMPLIAESGGAPEMVRAVGEFLKAKKENQSKPTTPGLPPLVQVLDKLDKRDTLRLIPDDVLIKMGADPGEVKRLREPPSAKTNAPVPIEYERAAMDMAALDGKDWGMMPPQEQAKYKRQAYQEKLNASSMNRNPMVINDTPFQRGPDGLIPVPVVGGIPKDETEVEKKYREYMATGGNLPIEQWSAQGQTKEMVKAAEAEAMGIRKEMLKTKSPLLVAAAKVQNLSSFNDTYGRYKKLGPSSTSAQQIQMLYDFIKHLDDSVVRPSEIAMAQSGGAWRDRWDAWYSKLNAGQLTPQYFLKSLDMLYNDAKKTTMAYANQVLDADFGMLEDKYKDSPEALAAIARHKNALLSRMETPKSSPSGVSVDPGALGKANAISAGEPATKKPFNPELLKQIWGK